MDRIGPDVLLAAAVAAWFVVTGLAELFSRAPVAGRRAVAADPAWLVGLRRARGAVAVLGGLAVLAGATAAVLRLTDPLPGRALGLGLAAIALWRAGEAARPPVRWLRLALAAIGLLLAVFYAGFRA